MGWVGDVAAEIDRLVVSGFEDAGRRVAEGFGFANAHPGLLVGVGSALATGPTPVSALAATYPYLPQHLFDALVENNRDEGVISIDDGVMSLTAAGRVEADRVVACFIAAADEMWAGRDLAQLEDSSAAVVGHARSLAVLFDPSAFAVQGALTDQPTQAARVFRNLAAARYWRADAHRAAWTDAGLSVQEAHALIRLWDLDRGVVRIGQGEERPGRTGVSGLTAKGLAAGETISDAGRTLRIAIEADTDARTEPIYARLDDAARAPFLAALRQLPIR